MLLTVFGNAFIIELERKLSLVVNKGSVGRCVKMVYNRQGNKGRLF
jgi:hypothetical protein